MGSSLHSPGRSPTLWSPLVARGDWKCVFLHLILTHEHTHTQGLKYILAFCGHKCHEAQMGLLPSDISSSSRRLIPISWEGAVRLSVGVGNSGNEGGDCGDVSNPVRSSSAVPPSATDRSRPGHHTQPFHTKAGTALVRWPTHLTVLVCCRCR